MQDNPFESTSFYQFIHFLDSLVFIEVFSGLWGEGRQGNSPEKHEGSRKERLLHAIAGGSGIDE
jgi:hypothetical protein